MNSNHTSVSAVRSVEQWSFPTRCFMRFKLGQSRTMSTIVRTIASAFNPNARGIARFHGRLYSRQFSFFTLLFFAHFIVSPIRLVRKALPLRFRQSTLMESSANHAILKSACFFCRLPASICDTGFVALSTVREPNNLPYCTCDGQRFRTEYWRSRVRFCQAS